MTELFASSDWEIVKMIFKVAILFILLFKGPGQVAALSKEVLMYKDWVRRAEKDAAGIRLERDKAILDLKNMKTRYGREEEQIDQLPF